VKFTSILAIYALFWVMSAFVLLPLGVKTHDEEGIEKVPGQADSAPAQFRPGRLALRATIVAALAFGLYYANYVNGWLSVEDINFFGHPPAEPANSGY
jgi:predicted secreted protein